MIAVTAEEEIIILGVIASFAPDCEVYAYGSRVKGTHKESSDLDLAFVCPNGSKMPSQQRGDLREAFGESDIVFRVDVTDYNGINQRFREIIDRGCVKIYEPDRALRGNTE
jgi:predicted nucleotidyltransferase